MCHGISGFWLIQGSEVVSVTLEINDKLNYRWALPIPASHENISSSHAMYFIKLYRKIAVPFKIELICQPNEMMMHTENF